MSTLRITRGYPASGKTTLAREWVTEDPDTRTRCNRDDLRAMIAAGMPGRGVLDHPSENAITTAQHALVRALLAAGKSVIVDDTNLRLKVARAWADLAHGAGAEFEVVDVPTDADECVRRDNQRRADGARYVGEGVIREKFAAKFPIGRWPKVARTPDAPTIAWRPYVPDTTLPKAWLVDIDGTIADKGDRSPYDWHRVGEDTPHVDVIRVAWALAAADDAHLVVMSGRDAVCCGETIDWLNTHVGPRWSDLIMRDEGDNRRDDVVKDELFETHVAPHFNVVGVLDDRDKVVAMWRAKGIRTLQVAPGAF